MLTTLVADADQIPTLVQHFVIVPIGMTVQALVPLPGGVGIGEYSFGVLYELIGKPQANGVLGSLVGRIINWGLSLVGYLVFLRMRPSLPPVDRTDLAGDHAPQAQVLVAS